MSDLNEAVTRLTRERDEARELAQQMVERADLLLAACEGLFLSAEMNSQTRHELHAVIAFARGGS